VQTSLRLNKYISNHSSKWWALPATLFISYLCIHNSVYIHEQIDYD
jgi:hypothetical protein